MSFDVGEVIGEVSAGEVVVVAAKDNNFWLGSGVDGTKLVIGWTIGDGDKDIVRVTVAERLVGAEAAIDWVGAVGNEA